MWPSWSTILPKVVRGNSVKRSEQSFEDKTGQNSRREGQEDLPLTPSGHQGSEEITGRGTDSDMDVVESWQANSRFFVVVVRILKLWSFSS